MMCVCLPAGSTLRVPSASHAAKRTHRCEGYGSCPHLGLGGMMRTQGWVFLGVSCVISGQWWQVVSGCSEVGSVSAGCK